MSALRPIAPIGLVGVDLQPMSGAKPIFEWVDPATLLIDDSYQRNLSEPSIRLIRKIIAGFDWNRFKCPVAVMTDNGLELLDGQHTSIAAASHPDIDTIPVMIVEAAEVSDRAAAFLGINRDRLNVSQTQIYQAAVVAGEPDAIAVARICDAIGIEVLRVQPRTFKPGQTVAVTALKTLVRNQPEEIAVRVLVILVNAGVTPIKADQIKAVETLLTDDQFKGEITDDKLTAVIRGQDPTVWEKEGKTFAATHSVPLSKALASVWFRDRNKRWKPAFEEPVPQIATPLHSTVNPASDQELQTSQPQPRSEIGTDGIKRSQAAPLTEKGWRAGPHVRRCKTCDQRFAGQPQATTCADCAYKGADA